MKEDFLHYLWKFRKFPQTDLMTADKEAIVIIDPGHYLERAGPDFFNAQLIIGTQKWAGNVEIHVNSSDWYLHRHENDTACQNVILHVVWENDIAVFRQDNSEIPVLELKKIVPAETLYRYESLTSVKSWIYCEKQLGYISDFVLKNWIDRLFFDRLQQKAGPISEMLKQTGFDWETVLFYMLAKNFGLNANGAVFLKMAQAIPFSVIRKENFETENLESLFFGTIGLLDADMQDSYFGDLQFRYNYQAHKYRLKQIQAEPVQFFKHRPDNFPTIRLAQLASLYHQRHQLFSDIIAADSTQKIYALFDVGVSDYWQRHYLFDRENNFKKKVLSSSFIDLIIINTIVPIRFEYAKSKGKEISETLLSLLKNVPAEKNAVVGKFATFGINAQNAFESQALLQLKKEYCSYSKCMQCAIGTNLLKE